MSILKLPKNNKSGLNANSIKIMSVQQNEISNALRYSYNNKLSYIDYGLMTEIIIFSGKGV